VAHRRWLLVLLAFVVVELAWVLIWLLERPLVFVFVS
jgi:hypothetical protein